MAGERLTEEQRILITQADPGMVLSRPVVSQKQVNLCGAGTTLSDPLIQRLTMRGIKRIFVKGQPVQTRSQEPLEERVRNLRHRFSRVKEVPLMAMIERAVEKELMKRQ